jgi:hypothetical protein
MVHRVAVSDVIAQASVWVEIFVHVMLRQPLDHQGLTRLNRQLLACSDDLGFGSIFWVRQTHVPASASLVLVSVSQNVGKFQPIQIFDQHTYDTEAVHKIV